MTPDAAPKTPVPGDAFALNGLQIFGVVLRMDGEEVVGLLQSGVFCRIPVDLARAGMSVLSSTEVAS